MSWEVPEGRHYPARPADWWYGEHRGVTAGETGHMKSETGELHEPVWDGLRRFRY